MENLMKQVQALPHRFEYVDGKKTAYVRLDVVLGVLEKRVRHDARCAAQEELYNGATLIDADFSKSIVKAKQS